MRDQPRPRGPLSSLLLAAALALPLPGPRAANAEPAAPHIAFAFPAGGQRGKTVEATISGLHLKGAETVRITGKGVTVKVLKDKKPDAAKKTAGKKKPAAKKPDTVRVSVAIAPDALLGERDLRIVMPGGASNRFRFIVGQLPEVKEAEPNSRKDQAQHLASLPVVVNGQVFGADRDVFRFAAKAGQTLVCEVHGRRLLPYIPDAVPGWLQSALTLYDAGGRELMYVDDFRFKPDPVLIYKVQKDGEYLIEVKDALYRGRGDFVYRLSMGTLPYITHIYPLGAQRKSTAKVKLWGANLSKQSLSVKLPDDCPPLRHVGLTCDGITSNALPFGAGDAEEASEAEPNDSQRQANRVKVPVTINGRIQRPGDSDLFVFPAEAKQELVVEVRARRLDSPLDSIVDVLSSKGRLLAQNDDTVDEGEPLITHHADSRLVYTFPSAGDYSVRIGDIQGKGGREYAYRLSIGPPRPDFALRFLPDNPRIAQGGTAVLTANAVRRDGFDGLIRLSLKNLPRGFAARGAAIPAKQGEVRFTITAPRDVPTGLLSPTLVGACKIAGRAVVREAVPAEQIQQAFSYIQRVPTKEFLLMVVDSAPLALSASLSPDEVVEVRQNGEAKIVVKAVRKEGAKGQIGLAADQPPKGVSVRAPAIPAAKNEATVTLRATKQVPVGFMQNIIITGTMKVGKETVTLVAPAIPIKIVPAAAPPKK